MKNNNQEREGVAEILEIATGRQYSYLNDKERLAIIIDWLQAQLKDK